MWKGVFIRGNVLLFIVILFVHFRCQSSMCRYCTSNEIFCYYCRNCGDVQITSETSNLTVSCSSCFECPVCKNVLRRQIDTEKNYGFTCSYCFYTTRSIGVADPSFQ